MALLSDIESAFEAARRTPFLDAAFKRWRSSHPTALGDFEDLEALIGFCRHPGTQDYARKSDSIAVLCLEARRRDGKPELAGLLLAWLLLPGLWELSNRLADPSRLAVEEMDAELLAGFWNVAAKIHPGSPKVAGRLIRGARNKALRAIARAALYRDRVEPTAELELRPSPTSTSLSEFDLTRDAEQAGTLTNFEARLIEATRLQGASLATLAKWLEVPYSSLKLKRWRAENRLAAWLRGTAVSPRRNCATRETNRMHTSPCVIAGVADPNTSDGNGRSDDERRNRRRVRILHAGPSIDCRPEKT